jgi:hypothetical protein
MSTSTAPVMTVNIPMRVPSLMKGGKVKKNGLVYLHKGEEVVPKNKVVRKTSQSKKKNNKKKK